MNDLELLRRYEPVALYTQGEMYFPCATDDYVRQCSLWAEDDEGGSFMVATQGELDLDQLAAYGGDPSYGALYLRFVEEPLGGLEYQRWLHRADRVPFSATGRLARVPLISRIAGSVVNLSLVVRGTVPGGTTAAAQIAYEAMRTRDPRRLYYARVMREGGWIVLHYLFFYPMNDWRSTFNGVNDHEADWEQAFVFLYQDDAGETQPRWVAYASHDFKGDDLRRRWDDPLLGKVDSHPVIYVGAGSHASYFEPGEYLMGATPEFLKPVDRGLRSLRRFWEETLGQGDYTKRGDEPISLRIPYIDYARGDGLGIGPGQDEAWTPVLISDDVPWVDSYRGLWGLDTRDPLGGERAPSGPKYNRDGAVRMSWHDPLGWAGLDKERPPDETVPAIEERLTEIAAELEALEGQIEDQRNRLRTVALDTRAIGEIDYLGALHREKADEQAKVQQTLHDLQKRQATLEETDQALRRQQARIEQGDWGSPIAHLEHFHHPMPPLPPQRHAVEVWAALSGALALFAVVALVALRPPYWPIWLVVVFVVLGAVESVTRGRLTRYLLNIAIILAIINALMLVVTFWKAVLVGGAALLAILMIRDNLRELRRS